MPRRIVASGQIVANPCCGFGLACVRLHFEQHCVEVRGAAVECDGGERRETCGEARQMIGARERETGEARHHRGAVHQREAFFRRERQRRMTEFGPDLAHVAQASFEHHIAFARKRGGHIRERRQIAACTDRAFRRNARQHAMIDQIGEAFEQHGAHAGKTVGQRVEPRGDHRERLRVVEILAHAAAVVTRQLQRQGFDEFHRHVDHARVAIAGVDAVHGRARRQMPAQKIRAALDARAPRRIGAQRNRRAMVGDRNDFFDRQLAAADRHRCRVCTRVLICADVRRLDQIMFGHVCLAWGWPRNRRN